MSVELALLSIRRTTALAAEIGGRIALAQEPSTFQKICNNIRYGVNSAGTPVVVASCLKTSGEEVETATVLWDVHADSSGQLHHRVAGNDKVVPPVK